MSKLETNTIDTVSGTSNLVIGSTNSSTVTFENGAVTGHNYPALIVALTTDQTGGADATDVKVNFNSVELDTDSGWDSSNYKYVVPKAGRYVIASNVCVLSANGVNSLSQAHLKIDLNGTKERTSIVDLRNSLMYRFGITINTILNLSVNDEVSIFGRGDVTSSTVTFDTSSTDERTFFYMYRIGA